MPERIIAYSKETKILFIDNMKKTQLKVLKYLITGWILLHTASLIILLVRIFTNPVNHSGFNILWLIFIYVITVVIGSFLKYYQKEKSRISNFLIYYSLITIALILIIYHTNILVPYEIWLKRGLPDSPLGGF